MTTTYPKTHGPQTKTSVAIRSNHGTVDVTVWCDAHGVIVDRAAILYSALDSATRHIVTYHVADGTSIYLDREYA